jgi:capsule assembly protein Wzi
LKKFLLIIAISFLLVPRSVFSYSSVTVPIEDPVYRQIDKLAAFGLITSMIEGQRPYVRSEIGRLIAEALQNYPKFEEGFRGNSGSDAKLYVDRILEGLKAEYHEELVQREVLPGEPPRIQGQLLDQLRFDLLYLDEDPSLVPIENGLGGIRAFLLPLVEERGGRHYAKGTNLAFETTHWVRLGKYFSLQAQPRYQMQVLKGADGENKVFIQRLNGRFTWNKLDLEIGRDSLNWGASSLGGLAFSNNARPLDFAKLSSISPFRYPFFFKKIGVNEWSLVVANLGPEQHFPHSWLVAYKNSNRGSPYFELGFGMTLVMGGEGAPPLSFGQSFLEFWGGSQGAGNGAHSNRNFDLELKGRIPKLRGTELYSEFHFEDWDWQPSVLFAYDISYLVGAYLPRLNNSGTLDLRLEYHRLSPRYSRSPVFTDGMTENNFIVGDPLGPASFGVTAEVNYDLNPKTLLTFGFRYSQRSNSLYQQQLDGTDLTGIHKIVNGVNESRVRGRVSCRHQFNRHLVGTLGMGFEQVQNFNFTEGVDKTFWMGEGGVTVYFSPYLRR